MSTRRLVVPGSHASRFALDRLDRREFLRVAAGGALGGWLGAGLLGCESTTELVGSGGVDGMEQVDGGGGALDASLPLDVEEATIADLQQWMSAGRATSRLLCELYLARIAKLDRAGPSLHAILETNPDALTIADQMDAERRAMKLRGPLHGIPVLIKGNIASLDAMSTTAGSLALVGVKMSDDSTVVRRLRAAGAVILGKTNLSEWANFRSSNSINGWSGQGGQCLNPYALDREPLGSSSGTGCGISANLASVGIGTETDGSILSPSSVNGLVGLKPTVGLISRRGIIPISHTQDTAGPMTRTVRDAAVLLGVLAGEDPDDPATAGAMTMADYTAGLSADGLKGARIGMLDVGTTASATQAIDAFRTVAQGLGATLVEGARISTNGQWGASERTVLQYEFKADVNAWLAQFAPTATVKTLSDLIAFNIANKDAEMPLFGQETFLAANQRGALSDMTYTDALARCKMLARDLGIDAAFNQYGVDAFACVTLPPACLVGEGDPGFTGYIGLTAVSGYPHITVPGGFTGDLPIGISFLGRRWSEATLLKFAYAFEQATHHRARPRFAASAAFDEC